MGSAGRDTLLDLRDVFSQDATEKLSFVPQAGADGQAVLVQMCSRCHDGRADPESAAAIQRARARQRCLPTKKQIAAARPAKNRRLRKKMPPWRSGHCTPEAQQRPRPS